MPQRKPQNKLPEIGECLEKLQMIESNVTEEDFLVIGEIKEYLDVIKAKWKTLNTNYKNVFQEKTNYEDDIEKMTQVISKMTQEQTIVEAKHQEELKVLNDKLRTTDDLMKKIDSENKKLIESLKDLEVMSVNERLDFSTSKDVLNQEKIGLEKELKVLKDLIESKDQSLESLRVEKESLYSILDSKYNILVSENSELLNKLKSVTDDEKKHNASIEELRNEKEHRIRVLESRISTLEYENEKNVEQFEDQICILTNEKKNMENLLNELTVKIEKKSKCCIM